MDGAKSGEADDIESEDGGIGDCGSVDGRGCCDDDRFGGDVFSVAEFCGASGVSGSVFVTAFGAFGDPFDRPFANMRPAR